LNRINQEGKCIIFSAPSGAGKTTIVRHLLETRSDLEFSISACSRAARGQEINGKDYYFLGIEGFKEEIEAEAFVEWEEVYKDNYYGTLKSEINRIWALGKHVIFDVDVVGGLNLKKRFGDDALAIFVKPPSEEVLEERLRGRQTETEEKIQMRLSKAREEIALSDKFDAVLLNDNLDDARATATYLIEKFVEL
jgi:guanylate kinase